MSPPTQQPQHLFRATVASAVGALTSWMRKRADAGRPNLLADERDDLVVLQLSLRRIPASPTNRPRLLPLPHPVIGHAGASICVISDDRPNSRSPPASDLLDKSKSLHLPVSEVIPLSTLRTDYRPYESRRRLAGSHDLFIADRAILPLLPRVLGKAFYSTKKAPIGVDFSRVGWPEQMRKVLDSTFLYLRTGTCSGIKVGRLDMEQEEIVENVMAAVDAAVEQVPKKWANVRALHLKAVHSVALPIYHAVPELGMKIEVPPVNDKIEVPPVAPLEGDESTVESDGEEVAKKKSDKRKRNKELEKEAEASKNKKKGRKSEPALKDVSNKKKKGKKEDTNHELEDGVVDVANMNNKKGKKKKNINGGGDDFVESLKDKKSKGKQLDGDKIKKTRVRVRV